MSKKTSIVVVDNTNTELWQISPYQCLAVNFGYEFEVHTVLCDPEVALRRNVHGVPSSVVYRMYVQMKNPLVVWKRVIHHDETPPISSSP